MSDQETAKQEKPSKVKRVSGKLWKPSSPIRALSDPTVVSVVEHYDCNATLDESQTGFKRIFKVVMSGESNKNPWLSASATGIPAVGDDWHIGTIADMETPRCVKVTSDLWDRESKLIWRVTCEYSNATQAGGGTEVQTPPWEDDAVVGLRADPIDFAVSDGYRVINSVDTLTPVTNAVGDPFDPAPTKRIYMGVITVTRASQTFNAATAMAVIGTTNSSNFNTGIGTIGTGMGYLSKWDAVKKRWKNSVYYEETIEILWAPTEWTHGWKLKLLNAGYRHFINAGATAKPTRATDQVANVNANVKSSPTQSPITLNADGTLCTDPAGYNFIEYRVYASNSWSSLGSW